MEEGVGMLLLLEGKKKLTIGVDGLELNDPIARKAGRSSCAPLTSTGASNDTIPFYNVLWAESADNRITIDYAIHASKKLIKPGKWEFELAAEDEDEAGGTTPAETFVKILLSRAYGDAPPRKRAYVLVNPNSGPGKAVKQWENEVKPLLDAAKMQLDVVILKRGGEAVELAQNADLSRYDTIMACSGDGTPHEIFNGLAKRPDAARALSTMAVSHIPCGSGNAFSCNLYGSHRPSFAALAIIKGIVTPLDLVSVTSGNSRIISFLSQTLGLIAECDLGTENMRWMGSARFEVGVVQRMYKKKCYPFDLAVKVEIEEKEGVKAHYKHHTSTASLAHLARSAESTFVADGAGLPELKYGTIQDELPEGWELIPYDKIGTFYAGNMAYMSPDAPFFAASLISDGLMDLVTIDGDLPFLTAIRVLLDVEAERLFDNPHVTYKKISAYRIIPRDQDDGYISIDGEKCPFGPFQAEIHQGLGRVISKSGKYEASGPKGWDKVMPLRGRGGRMPPGAWGRLKPVEQDPLQDMGLPSKGDDRLLNHKTQEWYYNQIISRFLAFCTEAGDKDSIIRSFEALDIRTANPTPAAQYTKPPPGHVPSMTPSTLAKDTTRTSEVTGSPPDDTVAPSSSSLTSPLKALRSIIPSSGPTTAMLAAIEDSDNTKSLQDVLMALRKLREGLVATKRADLFSIQAYIFSIRLSILVKHPESYHPAILHLLRYMAVWTPMVQSEIEEIAGYFMLDAACRRRDLTEAYFIRQDFNIRNKKLDRILKALAHDNYISWQAAKQQVDRYYLKLMEWADDDMRLHALKCFGRSYLHVDLPYLEFSAGRKWNELKEKDNVGWELEDEKVTIKRVRARRSNRAMPQPARKRARTKAAAKDDAAAAAEEQQSTIFTDRRTSWLVKGEMVELKVKTETFHVARSVLTKNSEYFEGCLAGHFVEAKKGVVEFDDDEIEPRYLGLYIGLAYSHSSIVPHTPPRPAQNPQTMAAKTPMRDYVEVYKLCDRFLSPEMGEFIMRCIDVAIGNGHRALYRTDGDEGTQKLLMRDFADGYEVLNMQQNAQVEMGERMITYFCEGVSYRAWIDTMEELMDRPKFVAAVSRGFATKLRELQIRLKSIKRRELVGPGPVYVD
ncbi:sphingosine kinase [Fusarium longipes]|uniref:Sphingosine kinase n=1 Tax=Fusarium longipes TaxID=694270 RepID=A0A395S1W6_9HYPO|nr:sphingosine kinase [Fusarium longipes]